jgi:protein TonB
MKSKLYFCAFTISVLLHIAVFNAFNQPDYVSEKGSSQSTINHANTKQVISINLFQAPQKQNNIKSNPIQLTSTQTKQKMQSKPLKKNPNIHQVNQVSDILKAKSSTQAFPLIQSPKFLKPPSPPNYPLIARKQNLQGTTTIEVKLSKTGKQLKLKVIKSSGSKVLDDAALEAVKQWKISPYIQNGSAIAHRVIFPIDFKLQ